LPSGPGLNPKRRHLLSQRQAILQQKRGKVELKNLRKKIVKNEIASNAPTANQTKFGAILKRHLSAGF
jgi:hypothetical protein